MKLTQITPNNIDQLDIVMDMIYEEWGSTFSSSKESKLQKLKEGILQNGKFPQIYLLQEGEENVAAFSILEHELKGSDLSPWLACVVVNKKFRGKGYGKTLLQQIKNTIEDNFEKIYLTTELIGFYEKIGFQLMSIIDNNGKNNRLYCKTTNKKET